MAHPPIEHGGRCENQEPAPQMRALHFAMQGSLVNA
jgi:hypothetical protein